MNRLNKTGVTVVAGGLVGALATVSLGASELVAVGDMGSFASAMPDGNSDCLIINTLTNTVDILYLQANGLNIIDTSGQLVDILVVKAGSGYGAGNANSSAGVQRWQDNQSPVATTQSTGPEGWMVQALVNSNGTGGSAGAGVYQIDGPKGGYFYSNDINRSNWYINDNRYYDPAYLGMVEIENGGTGYWPGRNWNTNGFFNGATIADGHSNYYALHKGTGGSDYAQQHNHNAPATLTVTVGGSGAGTFGFIQLTGNVPAAGNGGVFTIGKGSGAGDTNASMNAQAAAADGGMGYEDVFAPIANGMWGVSLIHNTNVTLQIFNDNSFVNNAPNNGMLGRVKQLNSENYGNYRLYLGHTPGSANGNRLSWRATGAGQVANLDIIPNSTPTVDSGGVAFNQTNGTSGIGYNSGNFKIWNGHGNLVTDVTIPYEIDSDGRVYVGAKGAWWDGRGLNSGNLTGANSQSGGPVWTTIRDNVNYADGWEITAHGSHNSTAGWTVEPQGNGFGFDCQAVHLWGQVVCLPNMGVSTNGQNRGNAGGSWNHTGGGDNTTLDWTSPEGTLPTAASNNRWTLYKAPSPKGEITDAHVTNPGQNYANVTAGFLNTQVGDTGTGGELQGVIGGVGRRTITDGGAEVVVDLFNFGWKAYMNGDFNGDGTSDILWGGPEGLAIWNMTDQGAIHSAGLIEDPGFGWVLAGIGKFGYSGTGYCLFWNNEFDGQTCVWVVNSSSTNSADWVVGGVFLDTVSLLSNTPRTTNNVVQNSGQNVYWQDTLTGQFAYWPVTVNSNITSGSTSGAAIMTLNGAEILFPFELATNIAGVGNMSGRPHNQGNAVFRDVVLAEELTGSTLIWLMAKDYSSIDTSAVGGGGGFVNSGTEDIVGNFYNFEGIGQFTENSVFALVPPGAPLPGGVTRPTWFGNLFWSFPDVGANFDWKMDRNLDTFDYRTNPANPSGTGLLVDPYAIFGTVPLD